MEKGRFLVDASREESRFRMQRLLFEGRSYQIALAEDTRMDDKIVCVKTILYDPDRLDDKKYVAGRRKALHAEMQFLAQPIHLIPEPLDWIQVEGSETVLSREPLLVYEYIHGETLHELVSRRSPEGIDPFRALRMTREIARFLAEIHERKYVFRDLDPRHVIVGFDDVIHVVGCGNATPIGERPNTTKLELNPAYTAPEVRSERSGKFLRPAADIYSLGALMSFMLTGEEPREVVENPLTQEAYEKLTNLEPPGIGLVIARCLQPLAKNRFGRAEKMIPFLYPEALPTARTEGFGLMMLPAPWSGAEAPEGRAARNTLSPGPLISVGRDEEYPVKPGADPDELERREETPISWGAVLAVAAILAVLAVVAFFLIVL